MEKGGHNLQIKHSASYKYIQVDVNNLYKYRVSIGFKEMHNFCTSLLSLLLHKLLLATPPPQVNRDVLCTGSPVPDYTVCLPCSPRHSAEHTPVVRPRISGLSQQ